MARHSRGVMSHVLKRRHLTSCVLLTTLLAILLAGSPAAADTAQQALLRQLYLGEARQDISLMKQALSRLTSIAPDSPEVLEARIRMALKQQNTVQADGLIEQLAELSSPAANDALVRMKSLRHLATPAGQKALAKARLFATAGRLVPAQDAFDALFPAGPPSLKLALEYWRLIARLPDGNATALAALNELDKRYPQSPGLNFTLAQLLLEANQPTEAYQRLTWLAKHFGTRDDAAKQWRASLQGIPPSLATVKAWQAFVQAFEGSQYAEAGRESLAYHRRQLADPAYQARRRGIAAVDAGSQSSATRRDLQLALRVYPDDLELLSALGILHIRQGRHAQALPFLRRAQQFDTNNDSKERLSALITTASYWQQIGRGDAALDAGNLTAARNAYRQATRIDPATPHGWRGLGDTALADDQFITAEQAYRQALVKAPRNILTLRRLTQLYAQDSPERALAFIDGLSTPQKRLLAETHQELLLSHFTNQADDLRRQGRHKLAENYYRQARQLAPNDVWLNYRLAESLQQQGLSTQSRALMTNLVTYWKSTRDTGPDQRDQLRYDQSGYGQARYAQALLLAEEGRNVQALASLEAIPVAGRDADILALMTRLRRQNTLESATLLYAQGRQTEAVQLLETLPPHPDVALQLGDWALTSADAINHYQQAVTLAENEPASLASAQLRLVGALYAQGETRRARELLENTALPPENREIQRNAANQWARLGEPTRAWELLDALLATPEAYDDAPLQRDAARLARQEQEFDRALDHYRQGLIAAGVVDKSLRNQDNLYDHAVRLDDATLTRALRSRTRQDQPSTEIANSLRSETAELYQARNTRLSMDSRLKNDDGTAGVSELTTQTQMFQVDTPWPYGKGRGFLQLDAVRLDAGRWNLDDLNQTRETFGTCAGAGCQDPARQRQEGVSLGLGWYSDSWRLDIGTTPLGFEIQDWTAGIRHNGRWGSLWTRATLSRRPLTTSLLAYAGTEDPRTGTRWGSVSANGLSLGLGYDQGGDNGFWSSLDIHQLEGRNVEDNQRVQLMGGVYRRFINQPDRQLTLGLSAIAMHYSKDLSGYALGQGGYYSPQQYVSLGIPLRYQRRHEEWNWELEASLSQSWTDSDDQKRYPLGGSSVSGLGDAQAVSAGESSGGLGFSATGILERRLTDHWQAGMALSIRESEDDSPREVQFYLRYLLAPWQGDLALSPSPLIPYNELD